MRSLDWKRMVGSIGPAWVTLLIASLLVGVLVALHGGDALYLARLGSRFSQGDAALSSQLPETTDIAVEGYDGQFVYYIARNPDPQAVRGYLDVPAYRYQRILLPLLARALSGGNLALLPWTLALLGLLSLAAGTWAVEQLLVGWGVSRWYALIYGLWAGFLLALIVDLPEPLAYGLAAGGFLALQRQRRWLGWTLLGLAVFAKEVVILFTGAALLAYLWDRRWRDFLALGFLGVAPYLLFQGWLWLTFGQPGIGSGGAMATPFELLPFMGLLRVGLYSPLYLLGMLVVFGPTLVWPALWGMWKAVRFWRMREQNVVVLALFVNGLAIAIMPFSTFRETGGVLRYACGLVLAVLMFAARYRQRRVLNYSIFWIVLNVFVFKG